MRADPGRTPAAGRGARGFAAGRLVPERWAGPLAGVAGAAALLTVGVALRAVLLVPSLPEVLSDLATFYVPFGVFELMINTFRGGAKVMLFWSVVALVALVAAGLGALYARLASPRVAVGLVLGLWLFTMLVVLPAADMGFFGSELRAGELAVVAAYLAGYAAFGIALSLVYWLLVPASRQRRGPTALQ